MNLCSSTFTIVFPQYLLSLEVLEKNNHNIWNHKTIHITHLRQPNSTFVENRRINVK